MWVAAWLICIASSNCHEAQLREPKYFFTKEECDEFASKKAIEMTIELTKKGHHAQVGYLCEESKSVRKAYGS